MVMDEDAVVAAILTAGVLMRMPPSGTSGVPERDRALRATEAVEAYLAVLKALRMAQKMAGPARSLGSDGSLDRAGGTK